MPPPTGNGDTELPVVVDVGVEAGWWIGSANALPDLFSADLAFNNTTEATDVICRVSAAGQVTVDGLDATEKNDQVTLVLQYTARVGQVVRVKLASEHGKDDELHLAGTSMAPDSSSAAVDSADGYRFSQIVS